MSRTAYNNFAHGRTKTQDRVRRPIGLLYLSVPPELRKPEQPKKPAARPLQQRVAERPADYGPGGLEDDLRRIGLETREEALRWLEGIMTPLRGKRGADVLEEGLRRWIDRTYPPGDDDPRPAKTRKKK